MQIKRFNSQDLLLVLFRSKSELFFLAYLVFLIVTLILTIFNIQYNRNTISAVIIVGAIFSVAELFYSLDAIKKDLQKLHIEAETTQIQAMTRLQTVSDELTERNRELVDERYSASFCEGFEPRSSLSIEEKQRILGKLEIEKTEAIKAKAEFERTAKNHYQEKEKTQLLIEALHENIRAQEIDIKKDPIVANIFMFIGIFAFLLLLVVKQTIVLSERLNSIITIGVFILLVLNYYIKQFYTNLVRQDMQAYKDHAQYFLNLHSSEKKGVQQAPILPHNVYTRKSKND